MSYNDIGKCIEAASRALAKRRSITVRLGGNEPLAELNRSETITLPSPGGEIAPDNVSLLRGEADLAALSLRYHAPEIHALLRPSSLDAAAVFDALERTRIEIIGSQNWQGVKANLTRRMHNHCIHFDAAEILSLLLRESALGVKPPKSIAKIVDMWRKHLDGKLQEMLAGLVSHVQDQREYALTANHILKILELAIKQQDAEEKSEQTLDDNEQEQAEDTEQEEQEEQEDAKSVSGSETTEKKFASASASDYQPPDDAEQMESDIPSHPKNTPIGDLDSLLDSKLYHAFTREFDEIVDAGKLASSEEISRLRFQLNQKLASFHTITSKLAHQLQRLLLAKQARIFEYGMDEGIIDSKRLANVIINPDYEYFYKKEKEADFRDTVVTLLIDNSGSMRGRPITVAALCADILARTLERCGVKVEILGFTTRDWKGGQARKLWLEKNRPINPGRLNDIRHIIYKSADTRWQKARRNLGVMLKDGILKENIDGEAIIWAHQRLIARPEQRRILMVISDGAPVDDSTLSSNNGSYLDRHLWQVIQAIENNSDVELLAIGIGHDVTRYYKRAVTISDISQLGDVMGKELAKLFA